MDKRILVLYILFSFGCAKQQDPIYQVPEEAQVYVDLFIEEGKKRGIELDITNLIIKYDGEIEEILCGSCNSISPNPMNQKIMIINEELRCWNDQNELEALFFHELGHCVLHLDHDDEKLTNNDPKSIMTSTSISLYTGCIYQIGTDPCNFTYKRDYYLDELFNPVTEPPVWALD